MSDTIAFVARKLQQQVPFAETRIDDALIAVSSLMTTVVTARRDMGGAEPAREQGTILRLADAQRALIDASGGMLRVHGELSGIARERSGLDLHECPAVAQSADAQRTA
ncbi:MAG TPA: hypothetical protein VN034_03065 [Sphingopyxis sp.]|nr:hypothetical protein [Sphingopyxis sp.]HWV59607.1 hypothetical protein [Sphingopyxis sp.]